MSFILDALKKSESDRLKQDTPGLSHVPDKPNDKTASPWILIVIVLIVINLAVLAVLFMRPAGEPASPGVEAVTREPVAEVAEDRTPAAAPAVALPAPVRAIAEPAGEPASQAPGNRLAATADSAPSTVRPADSLPAAPTAEDAYDVTESYATFNDLRAQGLINVPDLHLDIHVFSEQAAERFVFVNMSKYLENEALDEGPLVSEITPDGVVLVHRGMTFLLPRE